MPEVLLSPRAWLDATGPGALVVLGAVLAVNVLVSAGVVLAVRSTMPAGLRRRSGRDAAVLIALGGVLPGAGPLLLIPALVVLPRLDHYRGREQPSRINAPAFAPEIPASPSHFGVGGAIARLQQAGVDSRQGARALLAIEGRRSARTTDLLRETLRHPDENLRLLAHALVDRREASILRHIQRLEGRLAEAGPAHAGRLHLELADLHLELLYLGLVREGMVQLHLDAARHHLDGARTVLPGDPRMLQLDARVLHYLGDESGARRGFRAALEAGAPATSTLPYMAEIDWRAADYAGVRGCFRMAPVFEELPVVGAVARRWQGEP